MITTQAASGKRSLRDQLYVSHKSRTFENDEKLPSLPVPPLRQTLDIYLDTVRPVVSEEEYENTLSLVREFETGVGARLHQKLVEKAKRERNWLEQWWLDYAYLMSRQPLIPYSNMSAPFKNYDFWPAEPQSRIARLSLQLYHTLEYWKLLRAEKMRPMVHKGIAWDMSQFRKLFNTCRIAGKPQDTLVCQFQTEYDGPPASTDVIVMYRGHIFSINATDDKENPLRPPQLAHQLEYIQHYCQSQPSSGTGIGSLTADKRNGWASNRERLRSLSPHNYRLIEKIENAIMVVSMDDAQPLTQSDVLRAVMCGSCVDRWADKSLTTISYDNGLFGGSADHTPFDGLCTAIMGHYVSTSIEETKGVYKPTSNETSHFEEPERLDFEVDEQILNEIQRVQHEHSVNCADIDLCHQTFTDFGKAILKNHDFHPEAFIQLALQLAYYRVHGKPAPTYCTASTRQYYHGRTETCRSCFPEAVNFAKAFVKGDATRAELYTLIGTAVKKFQTVMKLAMKNEGCDRHFLGLYITSLEEGIDLPSVFTDPAFIRSGGGGNYILSTSCAGYWNICGGVPPMREDGYGCFYGIEDHQITFCCLAFKHCPETSAIGFYESIRQSLLDMQAILTNSKL